jgi:hypothetical protein
MTAPPVAEILPAIPARNRGSRALPATVTLAGLALVAVPLTAEPIWAYFIGAVGLAVAASGPAAALARRVATIRRPALSRWLGPAGWAGAGTLTAALAIAECAVSRLNAAALAAEGLLLLGYLLLLDAPAGVPAGAIGRWLRSRVRAMLAGVVATGLVLTGLAAAPSDAAWLLLVGLGAAMAAYLMAIPRRQRQDEPEDDDLDSDEPELLSPRREGR